MTGIVKPHPKTDRGFCFVRDDDTRKDYFLHAHEFNGVFSDLLGGERLAFDVRLGQKGWHAVGARPLA
jgi:cold shock CspA family protein